MCFSRKNSPHVFIHFELFVYFGDRFIFHSTGKVAIAWKINRLLSKRWKQILHDIWLNSNCKLIGSYIIVRITNKHKIERQTFSVSILLLLFFFFFTLKMILCDIEIVSINILITNNNLQCAHVHTIIRYNDLDSIKQSTVQYPTNDQISINKTDICKK